MILFNSDALHFISNFRLVDQKQIFALFDELFNSFTGDDSNVITIRKNAVYDRALNLLKIKKLLDFTENNNGKIEVNLNLNLSFGNISFKKINNVFHGENNLHTESHLNYIYILYIIYNNINIYTRDETHLVTKKSNILATQKIHSDVCEYLNQKLNTKYSASSNGFRKYIDSRTAEGYCFDDFKKVIDIKFKEWNGTDFEKYLRPQTLFGNKFESYLNQKTNTNEDIAFNYLTSISE